MEKKRVYWIDGLKLIACICVFFSHYQGVFFEKCQIKPEYHWLLQSFLASSFNLFKNGNLWMCMFCVISGYFAAKKEIKDLKALGKAIIMRYLRFLLPLLVVNISALLIANTIGFPNQQYGEILTNTWVSGYYNFKITLWIAVRASIKLSSELNSPLWMIYPLFIGTCLIYVYKYLCNKCNTKLINIIVCVVWLVLLIAFPSVHACYLYTIITMFGCILKAIWDKEVIKWRNPILHILVLAILLFVIGYGQNYILGQMKKYMLIPDYTVNYLNGIYAIIFLMVVHNFDGIKKFLETKWMRKGKDLSFGIYVTHWLVIFSVSLYVYGWLVKRVNVTMAFWIDLLITSVIVFLLANLFHKIVEKRIEWLLQKVQK